jgi:aspartokinase/homoserine dehydrogenase 1
MIVMKFGGSSLATGERIQYAADLVLRHRDQSPVVVVSAMGGVTDDLLGMARLALQGRKVLSSVEEHLGALRERHFAALADAAPRAAPDVKRGLEYAFVELHEICTGIALLGELSVRSIDAVSGYGEKLSAPIMAAAIGARGQASISVSAEELFLTDNNHGNARVLAPASRIRTRDRLLPLIEAGSIPVVTGFIGATEDGATTTFGRNASDYSAAVLGALLGADEVWKWTDSDGIMSADPRAVPQAKPLPALSYAEAAELAYFGSKVLHPASILPAVEAGVPFRIVNTFNPDQPGTVLTNKIEITPHAVKAVTAIRNQALVTVQGVGLSGVIGASARVFGAVAQARTNVLMISQSSSESNICFVIPDSQVEQTQDSLNRHLADELRSHEVDSVTARRPVAIVTVVGAGMAGTPGIAGRLFSCMGANGINVMAIAQGSNEYNISLVVSDDQALAAVRAAHREFVEDIE